MRETAATVTVVTAVGRDGRRYGLAATAFTSVSMEPPTLLVCVNTNASIHKVLLETGRMCVNILGTAQSSLVGPFSGALKGEERFTVGQWATHLGGLPYLPEAQSNLFCEANQLVLAATHSIVIARITDARVGGKSDPLLYFNGRCAAAAYLGG